MRLKQIKKSCKCLLNIIKGKLHFAILNYRGSCTLTSELLKLVINATNYSICCTLPVLPDGINIFNQFGVKI